MAEARQTQKTTKAAGASEASQVDTDETGILNTGASEADVRKAVAEGDQDRVAMASRKADGQPDQTPAFTYIDTAAAREATETQLTVQAVSNADQVVRAPAEAGPQGEGSTEPDPAVQQIVRVHEQAAEQARERVDSELGKDSAS
jgi:hypothetical protein